MKVTLRIWRQEGPSKPGQLVSYPVPDLSPGLSLLEALDVLNQRLAVSGQRPVAFESDCREGICGACGLMVDGFAHGPRGLRTSCQIGLRDFADGAVITIEPFQSPAFPLLRDLVVDRGALDRIVQAGGYISVRTGSAPEANAIPVSKEAAERALDAAACIGCGACVAACPNGSASLFVGAKLSHLGRLPQGQPERARRAQVLVDAMDRQGFGGCSFHGECQAACPKGIDLTVITADESRLAGRQAKRSVQPIEDQGVPGARCFACSLGSQGGHGIEGRRPPRGQPAGEGAHRDEREGQDQDGERIGGRQLAGRGGQDAHDDHRPAQPEGRARQSEAQAPAQYHPDDLILAGSQRHPHPDSRVRWTTKSEKSP